MAPGNSIMPELPTSRLSSRRSQCKSVRAEPLFPRARRADKTHEPLVSARRPRKLAQKVSQNSARSGLPCLTMISWGEIGADASSTFPANFGLATVVIDQTTAVAAMATIAVRMMSLRISCHPSL